MKSTAPSRESVDLVWERDGGACANCGRSLRFDARGFEWSLHHRTPRGSGGSRAPWTNLPSNLVLLHGSGTTGCHGGFEKNRKQAENLGFIVRHGIRLPADIPIQHFRYGLTYLTDTGTTNKYPPEERL